MSAPTAAVGAAPVVELRVDSIAAGGDGVGRAPDGRVVFVPLTAPGDRVRVRLVETRARYARGEVEALLEPGPARSEPRCAVFGACGGCSWQHLRYEAQIDAKRAIAREALRRIGGLRALPPIETIPSPEPYGYRSRARVLAAGGRVGYRRRRSHAVCAVTQCPLLAPALDRALGALAARPPAEDGEWELALGEGDRVRCAPLAAGHGAEPIPLRVDADRIEVSVGVFAQANAALLDPLARAVLGAAGYGEEALELFAGAGSFTLGLARRFARVTAVEADPAATRDLLRNTAGRHVRVIEARVEAWLERGGADALAPEAIVLDPPRGGLGPGAAARLAALPARRTAYLSCDPATLARDVAVLAAHGHRLSRLWLFDLFPQTPHVEVLALLERDG